MRQFIPTVLNQIIFDLKYQDWVSDLTKQANVYIVGGTVRDAFRGEQLKDIDLIVDGLSFIGIQKILKPFGKVSLVGESFSIIKFRPKGHEGEDYDIAIPRIDKKIGKGHKGFEIITDGVDIMGDLKRRDFTINSMAINIKTKEFLDPFGGLKDLKRKLIKATDPNAFIEDPLRILRGIQFAARFNYQIEADTRVLMKRYAHLIEEISGERIREEFEKILKKGANTQAALNLMFEADIDIGLFLQKMTHYNTGMDKLDEVSFFYLLGLLGKTNPFTFYMKRLRGNTNVGKTIQLVDDIIEKWMTLDDQDKKWTVFKAISKSDLILDVKILPKEVLQIISDMRKYKIPMYYKDVKINGNTIMEISRGSIKEGEELGKFLIQIYKDALMNKFKWSNSAECIDYVANIIYR